MIGNRKRVASVKSGNGESGWWLVIDEVTTGDGPRFDACLVSPEGQDAYVLRLWPNLERVFESVAGFLRRQGLSHVATALRVSAEAEVRE